MTKMENIHDPNRQKVGTNQWRIQDMRKRGRAKMIFILISPGHITISTNSELNPLPAKFLNLNFHPLKVVSRYRDPQLAVVEKFSHYFCLVRDQTFANLECLNTHFIPNNCDLIE